MHLKRPECMGIQRKSAMRVGLKGPRSESTQSSGRPDPKASDSHPAAEVGAETTFWRKMV